MNNWVVLKFGGTSVSKAEHWNTITKIVHARLADGERVFIVCSAIADMSRALESLIDAAQRGDYHAVLDKICQRHLELATELNVDGFELLATHLQTLAQLASDIALTDDAGPQLQTRVLAFGGILVTVLGAAFFKSLGLDTQWLDARMILQARKNTTLRSREQHFLAQCLHDPDPELQTSNYTVVLTQGSIASDSVGDTVHLSRGGSDISAARFAAKLQAARLEIWTDVPGLFTANSNLIPGARLLKRLEYDEAQELACCTEIFHPHCINLLRSQHIPLHIRSIASPQLDGTVINATSSSYGPHVKSVSTRFDLTLITIKTPHMRGSIGFLPRVFSVFERHRLSVGLVSTSETCVTVSIDTTDGLKPDATTINALLIDLGAFCNAQQISDCAAISLVGCDIQSVLHQLGPALEILDDQKLYLISQAANDLSFTFVVDSIHADRLTRKLHGQIFGQIAQDPLFGPTYRELFDHKTTHISTPWWQTRRKDLLSTASESAPCFVYDAQTILETAHHLQELSTVTRCFYSMKACRHPRVLQQLYDVGLGFECVSPGELRFIHTLFPNLERDRVLFTPNFVSGNEYQVGFELADHVTLDSVRALELWPEIFAGREVLVRIDPGEGHGHHKHVRTAGAQSKFGVTQNALGRLAALARRINLRITGLHAHVGSGILSPNTWSETAMALASIANLFPEVYRLNLGGGFGVPEKPGALPLDVDQLNNYLLDFRRAHPQFELWLEPGRYLVAESGVLLARVTQIKHKGAMCYVGIETGMNSLIRPALYGSYHGIFNLTRLDDPATMIAEIVGPICETGDIIGRARRLPQTTREGDVLLVATAGAYGRVMSSDYNMRSPAAEVVLPH